MVEVAARAAESSHFDVVEKSKPDKAALALMLLARGTAKMRVAEISGLDRGTISKLAWRHSETLESRKREMARGYAMAAEQYKDLLAQKAEQLEDNPEELALTPFAPCTVRPCRIFCVPNEKANS
jgi:hypothetical protein